MRGSANDDLAEKDYVPYIVNRALSYFPDTILHAQEMNVSAHIDKKLQYEYLLHSIRSKKRFSKWAKKEQSETIELLVEYYKCNYRQAEEYSKILTPEQIDLIRTAMQKGKQ